MIKHRLETVHPGPSASAEGEWIVFAFLAGNTWQSMAGSHQGSLKTMPPRRLWVGLPCSSYQGTADAGELLTCRSDRRRSVPGWRLGAEPVCFCGLCEDRRRPERREPLPMCPGLSRRVGTAPALGRTATPAALAAILPKRCCLAVGRSRLVST